ncbi:MAG: 5-methylcytosine-specific restriction endonuclease system specificity protein McrC [Bacillota bacterium]
MFRQAGAGRIAVEDSPDDIPDLVAEILAYHVERRIRRNLTYGYHARRGVLCRMRGRVDFLRTERHKLLQRGKIACTFDELTMDTSRNRLVRAALDVLARVVGKNGLARRCRSLAASLRRMGVTGERPHRGELSLDRFGSHDVEDRLMVAAAKLAFDLALPTEDAGNVFLSLPHREDRWVRKLFEKGVAGFYSVVLTSQGWQVDTGKMLQWDIEDKTSSIDRLLPSMRTDIILEHRARNIRTIVDTKFTSVVTRGWYREETLSSQHVYQIYSYIRSQERQTDPLSLQASGLLLYPAVGCLVDEAVVVQGHKIRFATVNLGVSAVEIRRQLLAVLDD